MSGEEQKELGALSAKVDILLAQNKEIFDWMREQGDVRSALKDCKINCEKVIDTHKKDHKWFAATLITVGAVVGGAIGWLINYKK